MARSWIATTGQRWKLAIFWLLFGGGLLLFAGFIYALNSDAKSLSRVLDKVSVPLMVAGFVWLFLSLRCPRCGGRPAWWMVKRLDAREWYVVLAEMESCPICRDEHAPESQVDPNSQ